MSKTPQATISVGDAELTRDVTSIELKTRTPDNNILRLTGGISVKVDDEFALSVMEEYK